MEMDKKTYQNLKRERREIQIYSNLAYGTIATCVVTKLVLFCKSFWCRTCRTTRSGCFFVRET